MEIESLEMIIQVRCIFSVLVIRTFPAVHYSLLLEKVTRATKMWMSTHLKAVITLAVLLH